MWRNMHRLTFISLYSVGWEHLPQTNDGVTSLKIQKYIYIWMKQSDDHPCRITSFVLYGFILVDSEDFLPQLYRGRKYDTTGFSFSPPSGVPLIHDTTRDTAAKNPSPRLIRCKHDERERRNVPVETFECSARFLFTITNISRFV